MSDDTLIASAKNAGIPSDVVNKQLQLKRNKLASEILKEFDDFIRKGLSSGMTNKQIAECILASDRGIKLHCRTVSNYVSKIKSSRTISEISGINVRTL